MLHTIYSIELLEYTSCMITAVIQPRYAKFYLDGHRFLQLIIFSSYFLAGTISISENIFFRILLSLLPKPIAFCSSGLVSIFSCERTGWPLSPK